MYSYSLKQVTAPLVEPVTASEVKLYTRIDSSVEDSLISGWITSARIQAEEFQRRSYINQEWVLSLDNFPQLPLLLPRSPVSAVTLFNYYDSGNIEYTYDLNNFIFDYDGEPARVSLKWNLTFPSLTLRPMSAVKIKYTAGYGATGASVPQYIKDAIMLYCAYKYENRTSEENKTPESFYNLLRSNRIHL
jgi:uncharacterized phiE125 gp8 family phage protein